jgi:hypothetical protein
VFPNGSEVLALRCFDVFPDESDLRLFFVPVFSEIPAPFGVLTVDFPAFPDVSEFSVASTFLVGIDHPLGRRRPFWSASTSLRVGIDQPIFWLASTSLWVGIDQPVFWSASTSLLVGIDQLSGRHRSFGPASTLRSASTTPVGIGLSALLASLLSRS